MNRTVTKTAHLSFLCVIFLSFCNCNLWAKKRIKNQPSQSKYEKLLSNNGNLITSKGLMNLYLKDGKTYLEIPKTILNKPLLMGSIVEKTSDPQESSVGYQPMTPKEVYFNRVDSIIYLKEKTISPISKDYYIIKALEKNNNDIALNKFSIKAFSPDSASVIDITDFLLNNETNMKPIDSKAYNSMDGWVFRKSLFKKEQSMISDIKAFKNNVSISCNLSYGISSSVLGLFAVAKDKPFTATVKQIFMLLNDTHYTPRLADSRIGTKWVGNIKYSAKKQGSYTEYLASRWNLKEKKHIVFYVDTLLPETWRKSITKSTTQWNKAFKKCGYEDVIQLIDYPKNDKDFDANNINTSTIRYVFTPSQNITDNCWCDPKTGEILSANIYIPHNINSKIQLDYFLQTAAVNKKAQTLMPDSTLIKSGLTSLLLKNIGHCIGLTDNMAASFAYDTDSLRDESFLKKHGLSASVMDNLPFNYLADNKTVNPTLEQTSLGEYDYWAIKYLYGNINSDDYENESNQLDNIIKERNNNKKLLYKAPQNNKAYYDPRGMSNDLGNDPIKAADIAFKNLSYVIKNANQWLDKSDIDYSQRENLYGTLINQIDNYIKCILQQVGGIYINNINVGDLLPSYQPVSKEIQRKSFLWTLNAIENMDWIEEKELANHCGLTAGINDYMQKFFGNLIYIQLNNITLSESKSENPYSQQAAANDLIDFLFKESKAGKIPSTFKMYMQGLLLDFAITKSNVRNPSTNISKSSSSKTININEISAISGMEAIEKIGYPLDDDRTEMWYGLLLKLEKEFKISKIMTKSDILKNKYDYSLFCIKKAMK